ncbi:MAG: ATP-dependent helicase HrpB [Deltaproteobacteria bacterium]|nr:ATP-dependent helicase HrpB [Deltaproteobacteria bacterium]
MALAPELPVVAALPALADALRARRRVVLVAPPGSGKTTRVAPFLLDSGLAGRGQIVLLQPRRVAARTVARRMARERGERVGDTIGFQVRFEQEASERTRIRVVTEGILTAWLQRDPALDGVTAVVLDEFHERSVHADLALALVKEVQDALRDDLLLVVMSATLAADPIAKYLDCPVVRAEGRPYPVTIEHRPVEGEAAIEVAVAEAALDVARRTPGDVLAFLPGVRAIEATRGLLVGRGVERLGRDVVPLHGSLDAREQDLALDPGARPRIVLATNIAETSLTIPGVTAVVDAGLVKVMRYDLAVGSGRLETERVSLASADQRAGRAGRLGPGLAVRLWSRFEHDRLAPFEEPEIRRIDLARVALELLVWGVADPARFPWFEAPDARALADARARLERLGAVDGQGLTALGRQIARVPTDPRVAAFLLAAGATPEAARLAALVEEEASGDVATAPVPAWTERLARQLERPARDAGARRGRTIAQAWLAGFGDRVAIRRDDGTYQVVGGRRAKAETDLPLVVALRVEAGRRGPGSLSQIRLWAAIEAEDLDVVVEDEVVWDAAADRVRAFRVERHEDLVLARRALPNVDRARAGAVLADAARGELERVFATLEAEDEALLARLCTLSRQHPELALPTTRRGWLEAMLPALAEGRSSFEELRRRPAVPIATAARALLGWEAERAFREGVPERLETPAGSLVRIQYELEGPPVLAVKVQEMFGLEATPAVDHGRLPVVLHLLSPAGRPLQVTRDLPSFWTRTWPAVRAEMRTRYPKHHWPEDPARALPSARTTARRLKPEP